MWARAFGLCSKSSSASPQAGLRPGPDAALYVLPILAQRAVCLVGSTVTIAVYEKAIEIERNRDRCYDFKNIFGKQFGKKWRFCLRYCYFCKNLIV
jgi:hypothetical protein